MTAPNQPTNDPAQADPSSFQLESKAPSLPESPPPVVPMPPQEEGPLSLEEFTVRLHRMDGFLGLLLVVLSVFVAAFAVNNSDFWMYLATGRLIAEGSYQVGVDPFLYTTQATATQPAVPWINHSWLYSYILYLLYSTSGAVGLIIAKAAVVVGLTLTLVLVGLRFAPKTSNARLWLVIVLTALAMVALSSRLLMQPTVVSFLFFGITVLVLTKGEAARLWLLPPLFALWVNVDGYFILGPLTVALFWLGMALQQLLGQTPTVQLRRLGLVLLVSLGACLLNPHHIQAFTLPAELSYALVQGADLVKLDLPDTLGAGGQVLARMQQHDPQFVLAPSPLNRSYLLNYNFGWNIASLCYFVLLALSLLSFVPIFLGGTWRTVMPRLLLWVVYTGLSLVVARLIPFFAIVAVPVILANIQAWRSQRGEPQAALQTHGARTWAVAGRLLTGLGLALLLYLAWPGWLHSRWGEPASPRRVSLTIDTDPSLQRVAEQLQRWHEQGQLHNCFIFQPDVANYCAWFARNVKTPFDHRFALYRREVDNLFMAREALWGQTSYFLSGGRMAPPRFQWGKYFRALGIDHVIVSNFLDMRSQMLGNMMWRDPQHWTQLYGDGRTLVFGWHAPDQQERFAAPRYDRDALAFGPVPLEQRPPEKGTEFAHKEPPFWTAYAMGSRPQPLVNQEAQQHILHYQIFTQQWLNPVLAAWRFSCWNAPVGLAASAPGSVLGPVTLATLRFLPERVLIHKMDNGRLFMRAHDEGPPADLILAVRCARRAVAESPHDPRVYVSLTNAYKLLGLGQEEYWANYSGRANPSLRAIVRKVQILAAAKQYLALRPDDADMHDFVGRLFLDFYYLDVALEHLTQAALHLRPNPQESLEDFQGRKENVDKLVQGLSEEIRKRRANFDLRSATLPPLHKYQMALFGPYKFFDANNQEHVDQRGHGLAQLALTILQEARKGPLGEQEKPLADAGLIRLLITTGRIPEALDELGRPEVLKEIGPVAVFENMTIVAAAVGEYAQAKDALEKLGDLLDVEPRRQSLRNATIRFHAWNMGGTPWLRLGGLPVFGHYLAQALGTYDAGVQQAANLQTLRGLLALESGDTQAAAALFRQALQTAEERWFPERPIAVRYGELMKGRRP